MMFNIKNLKNANWYYWFITVLEKNIDFKLIIIYNKVLWKTNILKYCERLVKDW